LTFKQWWEENGQRKLCFTAKQWAKAGWQGYQMHSTGIEEWAPKKLLLDKPNDLCHDLPVPPPKGRTA
jgi:hypothetical protein